MTDEQTTTPAAPVDPSDTPSTQPASVVGEIGRLQEQNAELKQENERLTVWNAELETKLDTLKAELDEALGVHKPKPFPCAVYRDDLTREARDELELTHLIAEGWSETPK